MNKPLLTFNILLPLLLLVGALESSPASPAPQLDGKQVFLDQKCNMCHSVEAENIEATTKAEKMKGPDLSTVTSEHEDELLADYLRRKAELNGKKHAKPFTKSDEELGALLGWLHTVADQ